MNDSLCICQQLFTSFGGDYCVNCGQHHYGAIPFPTQQNNCCSTRQCMLCSSYEDSNILGQLDEIPTKDFNGNSNPQQDQGALNNSFHYSSSTQPYSRSYPLASSQETKRSIMKKTFTDDKVTNGNGSDIPRNSRNIPISSYCQRRYRICCRPDCPQRKVTCSFFENVSGHPTVQTDQIDQVDQDEDQMDPVDEVDQVEEVDDKVDQVVETDQTDQVTNTNSNSTTSLDDGSDVCRCDHLGDNLSNSSSHSTMGGPPLSSGSMPWLQGLSDCLCACSLLMPLLHAQHLKSMANTDLDQPDDEKQYTNRTVEQKRASLLPKGSYEGNLDTRPHASLGSCRGAGTKQLLQQQAGELAKMRHSQEKELRCLEMQEPTAQLKEQIDALMAKQQEEQLRLQEKHRQQLDSDNSNQLQARAKEQKLRNEQPGSWKENQRRGCLCRNSLLKPPKKITCNKCCCSTLMNDDRLQQGDGANKQRRQSVTAEIDKDVSNIGTTSEKDKHTLNSGVTAAKDKHSLNPATNYRHTARKYCDCTSPLTGEAAIDRAPRTENAASISYDSTKSAPSVLASTPFVSNFLSSIAFGPASEPGGTLGIDRQRHVNAYMVSKKLHMDTLRAERNATLQREMAEAHKSRQRLADAMAQLTFKHTRDVIARVSKQREENALKAIEQRYIDTDAADYVAALQRENDSIEAAKMRMESAYVEADNRREVEKQALVDLKQQEEQMSQLKQREIDLAGAAIKRQLADEETAAVLRQMKEDELHRTKLAKEQAEFTQKLQNIQLADLARSRKKKEFSAVEESKIRQNDAIEAEKRRKIMEDVWQQHQLEVEQTANADARRRQEREAVADAEHKLELKKAAWYRELQAIQAANRRKEEEEEALIAAKRRRNEEAARDQGNKAALQEIANRFEAEERAFEEQKKFIQDEANDRIRRRQLEQERPAKQVVIAMPSTPTSQTSYVPALKSSETESLKSYVPPPVETSTSNVSIPKSLKSIEPSKSASKSPATASHVPPPPAETPKSKESVAKSKKLIVQKPDVISVTSKAGKSKEELERAKRQANIARRQSQGAISNQNLAQRRSTMSPQQLAAIRKSRENLRGGKT